MPLSPKETVKEVQEFSYLVAKAFVAAFRRPYYVRDILTQMDLIGVGSLSVIVLTGFFTGAVLTLQTSKTLSTFGAVGFTGQLVAVSLVRELGPVLASLMVAGRVGSGIASELDASAGYGPDQKVGGSSNPGNGSDAAGSNYCRR